MPHINLPELPGIRALLTAFPQTGRPLIELAEALLRGPSPLTPAERELIAAYVSSRNRCFFCTQSHAAAARHLYGEQKDLVDRVLHNASLTGLSPKMQALLQIAAKVQASGQHVSEADIAQARAAGATDQDIHDTVLIAAAFCMYNRYVDGLATWAPQDPKSYEDMGAELAQRGYASRYKSQSLT